MEALGELVRVDRGPFGLPRGVAGRIAGWLMAANDSQHRELVERMELPERGALCEVGFGPGALLSLVCRRFPDARAHGVDPSIVMLDQARRRLASAQADYTPDLRLGAVGRLPFDDAAFDITISVNTIVFWPDLAGGLREIARVTRPQGTVMLAWHGGSRPSRIQRRLVLDSRTLTEITTEMDAVFGEARHEQLRQSELLIAYR